LTLICRLTLLFAALHALDGWAVGLLRYVVATGRFVRTTILLCAGCSQYQECAENP
jgi:hypothetical protein